MTFSLILAWVTVLFSIVTAFKYIVRISKCKRLNHIFHKIHIPIGIALVLTGLIHGLLAGNFKDTGLTDARLGTVFFSFNWGTVCFVISVLLGLSYLLRRVLKNKWMKIHRLLTFCFLALIVIHVADVGIQLPSRLTSKEKDAVKEKVNESAAFSGAKLKDGVYQGEAEGYKDTIRVSVTVENGAVTDIEILKENDTPEFFERAEEITKDIIEEQTLGVDIVSGATYSSVGILNAVNNALNICGGIKE